MNLRAWCDIKLHVDAHALIPFAQFKNAIQRQADPTSAPTLLEFSTATAPTADENDGGPMSTPSPNDQTLSEAGYSVPQFFFCQDCGSQKLCCRECGSERLCPVNAEEWWENVTDSLETKLVPQETAKIHVQFFFSVSCVPLTGCAITDTYRKWSECLCGLSRRPTWKRQTESSSPCA
jgi:hypothetical protein